MFSVYKLYSIFESSLSVKKYNYLSKFIKIPQICFIILQLSKHKSVNSLEIYPKKGIQYSTSAGSKSYISKTNFQRNVALIKLPSGVHKVFSLYSVGSEGVVPFNVKNLKTESKAGFSKKKGKKSLSRGVAKNPVDHPHGGRNKAIKYQRTP
jgi:large subunit ribosomal protein L2